MNDAAGGPPRAHAARHRLFTPGPLTTSDAVRAAAAIDLGSRSPPAAALTARLRAKIARIAGCGGGYSAVPLQGSGTFAVEAMLCSLLADDDHVLIVENGAYSERMTQICRIHGIRHDVLACDHAARFDLSRVERALDASPHVTHVAAVHFETALGVLNDVAGLVALAARHGRRVLLDAISTFGAYPLDFAGRTLAALALSSNKCLHGLPGLGFVIADEPALARRPPPAHAESRSARATSRARIERSVALHAARPDHARARSGDRRIRCGRRAARAPRVVSAARAAARRRARARRRRARHRRRAPRADHHHVRDAAARSRPHRRARAIPVRARARNLSDQALESGFVPGRRDRRTRRCRHRRTRSAHVRVHRAVRAERGTATPRAARGRANAAPPPEIGRRPSAVRYRSFAIGHPLSAIRFR
ncbi:aminotransferase class V-fold PLP-dependent enzyme [Burkholderia savannae]|uniref:aminotransferase class V-fold PLP-dependent enzyme n=1 Tax=Burkholderia savannae TaxID=1637837 RepID=UPI001E4A7578|nr:aminotransferase class V-fold PLP-dependent enzyme [Burkholderia savannae]